MLEYRNGETFAKSVIHTACSINAGGVQLINNVHLAAGALLGLALFPTLGLNHPLLLSSERFRIEIHG